MCKDRHTDERKTKEPEVVIRPFQGTDRDAVSEFFDQMGGESRAFFNRDDGNRFTALKFFDEQPKDKNYFMAELNGVMVGLVFLYDMKRSIPWLGIAVREEYKGMHIGRKLMDYAASYAESQGKGGILLTTHVSNIRGQALYERSGYERMGMHESGEALYLLRW